MEPSVAVLEVEEAPRPTPLLRKLWRPDIAAASLLLASIVALAVVEVVPVDVGRSGTSVVLHTATGEVPSAGSVEAVPSASGASGKWILGSKGQSCSQVCDAHPGVVCANAALIERNTDVDNADKVNSTFESAGHKCDRASAETDFDQASVPYLIDYGFIGTDCIFTTSGAGDCAATPRRDDEQRLCWCEPGDGPSPTPAPVKECTWGVDCKPIDCNGAHDMCLRVQSPSEGNSGCRLNHGFTYGTCHWGGTEEEGACCYMGPGVEEKRVAAVAV